MLRMTYALAVDPDAARSRSTVSVVAGLGLEPKLATDGAVALELLRTYGRPALMVTELVLPRLDGFVLLRRLRAMSGGPTRVIVVSSSRAHREEAERARSSLGIDALLSGATSAQSLLRVGRLLLGPSTGACANGQWRAPQTPSAVVKPRSKIEAIVWAVAADFGLAEGVVSWWTRGEAGTPEHGTQNLHPLVGADGTLLGHLCFQHAPWDSRAGEDRLGVLMREIVREIENASPARRIVRRDEAATF